MTTELPEIALGIDPDTGGPFAMIGDERLTEWSAVLEACAAAGAGSDAPTIARLFGHFARPLSYEPIDDPAEFEARFREALVSEDHDRGWVQSSPRLGDFGIPEFASIHPPRIEGDRLVFFARDTFTGMPYRAEGSVGRIETARFVPVPTGSGT